MPNENSIKILNQACEFAYMNCDRDIVPGVWDSLFAGKFFELTVQECMSVADLPLSPCGNWKHLTSSEVIAAHFGVEE